MTQPGRALPPTAGDATEQYGRSLAILNAAERALRNAPGSSLHAAVLRYSSDVLSSRVSACTSLLDAGVRLPAEVMFWLHIDEQLVRIPDDLLEPSWSLEVGPQPS